MQRNKSIILCLFLDRNAGRRDLPQAKASKMSCGELLPMVSTVARPRNAASHREAGQKESRFPVGCEVSLDAECSVTWVERRWGGRARAMLRICKLMQKEINDV